MALFEDCEKMEVCDFLELVTQFRGQKQTTVKERQLVNRERSSRRLGACGI